MIVKLEEAEVEKALSFLETIYPRVRFTSKGNRHYIEFPPGLSSDGSAALSLLSRADQTVHQEYLPLGLKLRVETVRNKYSHNPEPQKV